MTERISKTYEDAVASKLLPGITAIAGNKNGEHRTEAGLAHRTTRLPHFV